MRAKRSIGTQGIFGHRRPLSFWYVYIPSGIDRDKYIANCTRTNTVTIINDNNEILHKVKVGKLSLQKIQFPKNQDELGSPVLCGNLADKNLVVVIDVFDFADDFDELLERESALLEKTSTGIAEVRVQGEKGIVIINVDASQADGGKLLINVTNSESSGELSLKVDGSVLVETSGKINIHSDKSLEIEINEGVDDLKSSKVTLDSSQFTLEFSNNEDEEKKTIIQYKPTVGLYYLDEFDNEISVNKNRVKVKGKNSVLLGDGSEPIVLGSTLASLLNDLISEISSSVTSNGGTLVNSSSISALSSRVSGILSSYSKTD